MPTNRHQRDVLHEVLDDWIGKLKMANEARDERIEPEQERHRPDPIADQNQ